MNRRYPFILAICISLLWLISCTVKPVASLTSGSNSIKTFTTTSVQSTTMTSLPWANVNNPSTATPSSPPSVPTYSGITNNSLEKSIVVVWGSDGNYSTGLAVGDGSHVLTAWNFEDWSPTLFFDILVPGGKLYKAHIQAYDSRTALTLLQVDGMKLPAAKLGDSANIKSGQEVTIREWNFTGKITADFINTLMLSSFGTYYSTPLSYSLEYLPSQIQQKAFKEINPGAVITDGDNSVIGIAGVLYNDTLLIEHPHITSSTPLVPTVGNTTAIRELLQPDAPEQSWANGPLQINIAYSAGGYGIYSPIAIAYPPGVPIKNGSLSNDYDSLTLSLRDAETKLGLPLSADEIKGYNRLDSDGITLTTIYSFPVNLSSSDEKQLAKANWVTIQWDRKNSAPNRLFYGTQSETVEGGFQVVGDITSLENIISSLMPK